MIEATRLTRRYGDYTAVQDLSFTVGEGEILGLLGPNGAGKTTTIRMITGYLPPSAGRVVVAGEDLQADPQAARRQIGYLPETVALYGEMRVEEYLRYRARLQGMSRQAARASIEETMERCLVADVRRQIISTLSKGYRQRVGLAAAIVHQPKVLVLDEPTVGLDPRQIIAIRELIRDLGSKRTLLLSTHILPEVELLCDRVVIIDRGKVVDQGTTEGLRERWRGGRVLDVSLLDAPDGVAEALERVAGVETARADQERPGSFRLECATGSDPRAEVFRAAVEQGWTLVELAERKASLEDLFVRLTAQQDEAAPATEEAS